MGMRIDFITAQEEEIYIHFFIYHCQLSLQNFYLSSVVIVVGSGGGGGSVGTLSFRFSPRGSSKLCVELK